MSQKIILSTQLALGDVVCATAAVRELHTQCPGEYITDVRTPFPELWEQNPFITPIDDDDPEATRIEMHYDRDPIFSVNQSNQRAVHLLQSYCQDLANHLGLRSLHPGRLAGDIYLSRDEYGWKSVPHEKHNVQRYWIICLGGGKTDFTTKWYLPEHAQRVVDYFRHRIQFVQVGALDTGHWHPELNGVIDLRGQTDLRQLIRTVHSACGVLCGITSLMHLAAAVPLPTWQRRPRPCVVVAGGREPRSWYGYPTHRILETVGALPCCATGGCWQSHTMSIGYENERLCERVVNGHPKCMSLIRPESVILEIEKYLESEGVE